MTDKWKTSRLDQCKWNYLFSERTKQEGKGHSLYRENYKSAITLIVVTFSFPYIHKIYIFIPHNFLCWLSVPFYYDNNHFQRGYSSNHKWKILKYLQYCEILTNFRDKEKGHPHNSYLYNPCSNSLVSPHYSVRCTELVSPQSLANSSLEKILVGCRRSRFYQLSE